MKVGIVGLGVIGCSFAKAIKLKTHHIVLGVDRSSDTTIKARINRMIDDTLTYANLSECEIVLLCMPLGDTIKYLEDYSRNFSDNAIVLDCTTSKQHICRVGAEMSRQYGYTFIGANPVTDTDREGIDGSHQNLFDNCSIVLATGYDAPIQALNKVNTFLNSIGFSNIEMSSPRENDRLCAYTMQLPKIISSAYIGSESATEHYGFSGTAYKEITRGAKVNEGIADEMVENADFLAAELDGLIERLTAFSDALTSADTNAIKALLREGKKRKEYIDGKENNLWT